MVGSVGTRNALDIAKKYGAKFLHASTSECYGDPSVHPQTEDYWGHVNPIGIRSVYDEAKRFSEALVMAYHRYHKVDTRLVRIFNTYGPRLQKERWPRDLELHDPGAEGRRPDDLRRRRTDAKFLLCVG